jgi:hypothetical protein
MPPLPVLEQYVYLTALAGYPFLLAKLFRTKLARTYPFFAAFLTFQMVRTAVLLRIDHDTTLYGHVWVPTELTVWVLYYLVIYEVFSLVLRDYPGIQRWGKRVLLAALGVSIVMAGVSLAVDVTGPTNPYPILWTVNVIRRGVSFSLVLFIILMMAYLAWFPVPQKRNVIVHAVLNVLYFMALTVGVFYRNMVGYEVTRRLSFALGVVTAGTIWGWTLLLTRRGEEVDKIVGFRWSRRDEARLLGQLRAINDSLLSSTRK